MTTIELIDESNMTFEVALEHFLNCINLCMEEHAADFGEHMKWGEGEDFYFNSMVVKKGRRYLKVCLSNHGESRSVYCFVDKSNGNILKGARGNIFKTETYEGKRLENTSWLYAN
jgi:hypothetical protein